MISKWSFSGNLPVKCMCERGYSAALSFAYAMVEITLDLFAKDAYQTIRPVPKMCPVSPLYSIQKSVAALLTKNVFCSLLSFLFFSSHERFSPDSTGIRTLNYLSCCIDWVSRYQPGSGRNYRRSGSPNQTTAPPGQRSRFNPQRKPDT